MKVAFLTDFAYWEGRIGSSVRVESLCRSLTKVCDLTVISSLTLPNRYHQQLDDAPYNFYDRTTIEDIIRWEQMPNLAGVRPDRQVAVKGIQVILLSERFDAVITPYFNRDWMIAHLPPHIVNIVDTIDCQSQRARSFAAHKLIPKFLVTPEDEGAMLDKYDIAMALSAEDQAEFFNLSKTPIVTAPFRLPPKLGYTAGEDANRLLFIAAQSDVNSMTLDFLMAEILPLVPKNVVLNIVGNVTVPPTTSPNVKVVRYENVDDLSKIYASVDLSLNPTFAGGGIKTKTLEAIAHGVPVVTSDEGARGLFDILPAYLIANDKETFAHRISELLDDPVKRLQISREMRLNLTQEDSENWLDPFMRILNMKRQQKQEQFNL